MNRPDKVDGFGGLEQPNDQEKPKLEPERDQAGSNSQRRECSDWAAVSASNTSSGKVTVSNVQGLQLQGGVNMVAGDRTCASTRKLVDQSGHLNYADRGKDIRYCSNWGGVLLTNRTTGDVVLNNYQGLQIQGGVEIKSAKAQCSKLFLANEVRDEIFDVEGTTADIKLRQSGKRSLQPDSTYDDPEPQLKRSRGNVDDSDTSSVINSLWNQILQPTTLERVNVLQQQLGQLLERLAARQDMGRRSKHGERGETSDAVNGTGADEMEGTNDSGFVGKGVN